MKIPNVSKVPTGSSVRPYSECVCVCGIQISRGLKRIFESLKRYKH